MSTLAAGRYYNRSQDDPVGPDTGDPAKDAKREEHLRIAVNVRGLARLTHLMGDYFTIETPRGSMMTHLECYKELLALAGVFIVQLDSCRFGADYRKGLLLITNAPWLVQLSRDCPGSTVHRHADQIAFGKQFETSRLAKYPDELCKAISEIVVREKVPC